VIVVSLLLILVSGGLLVAGILRAEDQLVITSIGVSLLAAAALFVGIRQQREALARRAGSRGMAGRTGDTSPAEANHEESPEVTAQAAHDSASAGGYAADASAVAATPASVISTGALPADAHAGAGRGSVHASTAQDASAEGARSPVGAPAFGADQQPPGDEPSAPDTGAAPPTDPSAGADEAELVDEDPPDEPAAELVMSSEVSRLAELDSEVMVVDGRPRYHLRGCPHLIDKEDQALPVAEAIELGFTACSECSAATTLLAQVPRK
jgi:hypothetical protein